MADSDGSEAEGGAITSALASCCERTAFIAPSTLCAYRCTPVMGCVRKRPLTPKDGAGLIFWLPSASQTSAVECNRLSQAGHRPHLRTCKTISLAPLSSPQKCHQS